jgi:hypothetical protein
MIFQIVIFNGKYAPRGYRAISPRTRLASQINPLAVQVMNEAGLDIISSQKPKMIRERKHARKFRKVSKHSVHRQHGMPYAFHK